MNFLPGTIFASRFSFADAALPLPALSDKLEPTHAATLVVRRQDLILEHRSAGDTLTGTISLVELLGSEKLVEVELSGQKRISVQFMRKWTSI